MHRKYLRKYGLQIHPQTKIGYGLYIGHGVGIIVNSTAEIGNNCNLSQFTTIGTNRKKAAIIGDNVYIGPSVCIVEDVNIGNNVTIGAGAVVVKDIPENATVAGIPAKILNYNNPGRYVNNRWGGGG
jgi:serine O-acetyltransferase